jgi:hypothetical protein
MSNTEDTGRQASIDGFAHEHIVVGILMKKYQNVSLVDLPLSTYDIIIVRKTQEGEDIIRAQVKTSTNSVSFTGGTRGGVDREYKSSVKEYKQSTNTSDIVIGIHNNTELVSGSYDLYFVPTCVIEKLDQKSISINKIQFTKNNFELLEKCKNIDYCFELFKSQKII